MDKRKSKRSVRVALVLGAAVAGTALVGWGGLAAWQAYTDNAGNSVAAGTLSHTNNTSCVSNSSLTVAESTGKCSAVITVTGVDPENFATLVTPGTVKIDNTGSLNSTFAMSMPTAPSGGLCADLTLAVTDLSTTAPDGGTPYTATALSTQMSATNIYNDGSTPSLTWSPNGVAGTGSGATGNTFTLTVGQGSNFASNNADAGQSCTFDILFTQTSA